MRITLFQSYYRGQIRYVDRAAVRLFPRTAGRILTKLIRALGHWSPLQIRSFQYPTIGNSNAFDALTAEVRQTLAQQLQGAHSDKKKDPALN